MAPAHEIGNPLHRCSRWWDEDLECPFKTLDEEEDEDEEPHDRESLQSKPRPRVPALRPVPVKVLQRVTELLQTANVPKAEVQKLLQVPAGVPITGTPVLPSPVRAPAQPNVKGVPLPAPHRLPRPGRPSQPVLSRKRLEVLQTSMGMPQRQIQLLEETGWLPTGARAGAIAGQGQRHKPLLATLAATVAVASAGELLASRFVSKSISSFDEVGDLRREQRSQVHRRGKQTEPRHVGPQNRRQRRRGREERARGATQKSLEKFLAGQKGVGAGVNAIGRGMHAPASTFRHRDPAVRLRR